MNSDPRRTVALPHPQECNEERNETDRDCHRQDAEEEPQYDSDILTDSDEDEIDGDSDDESSSDEEDNEESSEGWEFDETYINFLNSVLFDEELVDDEDDAEYKPEDGKDEEELDDDEIYHEGTGRLGKHELMELVDGCLQTIAGEAPAIAAASVGGDPSDRSATKSSAKTSAIRSSDQGILGSADTVNVQDDETNGEAWQTCPSMSLMGFPEDYRSEEGYAPDDGVADEADDAQQSCHGEGHSLGDNAGNKSPKPQSADQRKQGTSAMSRIVNQIFTEDKPEVCIDGLPVEIVRKLAARQMSMASQLLLQLMLLSAEDSDCHSQCIHWISDLAANRDLSVKKATLMSMSMKPILKTKGNTSGSSSAAAVIEQEETSLGKSLGSIYADGTKNNMINADDTSNLSTSEPDNARITRGLMKRTFGSRTTTTYSVLDLPMISKLGESIALIQRARHDSATFIHQSLERSYVFSGSVTGADKQAVYMTALQILQPQILTVCQRTGMRYWSSLVPNEQFPLSQEFLDRSFQPDLHLGAALSIRQLRTLDSFPSTMAGEVLVHFINHRVGIRVSLDGANSRPVSMVNANISEQEEFMRALVDFTPAEADMLLRGQITFKNLEKIVEVMLPHRTAHELRSHFKTMVSLSAPESNKFKLCVKYEQIKKNNQVWTHAEDLELLRGFQLFGSKWSLYHMFFLPHKRKSLMKSRWLTLHKMQPSTDRPGGQDGSNNPVYSGMSHVARLNLLPKQNLSSSSASKRSLLSAGGEIFLSILKTIDREDPGKGVNQQSTQRQLLSSYSAEYTEAVPALGFGNQHSANIQSISQFSEEAADEEVLDDSDDDDVPARTRASHTSSVAAVKANDGAVVSDGMKPHKRPAEAATADRDDKPDKLQRSSCQTLVNKTPSADAPASQFPPNHPPSSVFTPPTCIVPPVLDPLSWLEAPFPAIVPLNPLAAGDLGPGGLPTATCYPPMALFPPAYGVVNGPSSMSSAALVNGSIGDPMSSSASGRRDRSTIEPSITAASGPIRSGDHSVAVQSSERASHTQVTASTPALPLSEPAVPLMVPAGTMMSTLPGMQPSLLYSDSMSIPMSTVGHGIDPNEMCVQTEMQKMMMKNSLLMGSSLFGGLPYLGPTLQQMPFPLASPFGYMHPAMVPGFGMPMSAPMMPTLAVPVPMTGAGSVGGIGVVADNTALNTAAAAAAASFKQQQSSGHSSHCSAEPDS